MIKYILTLVLLTIGCGDDKLYPDDIHIITWAQNHCKTLHSELIKVRRWQGSERDVVICTNGTKVIIQIGDE